MQVYHGKKGFKSEDEGRKVMAEEMKAILYESDNLLVGDTASWAKDFFAFDKDNGNFPQFSKNGVPISEYLHQLNCRLSHGTLRTDQDKKSVHIYTTIAERKDARQKVCLLNFKEKEDTFVVRRSSVSRGTKEAFFYKLLSERLMKKSKDFRFLKQGTEIRFPPERVEAFVEVINQLIRDNEENMFKLYITKRFEKIQVEGEERYFNIGEWREKIEVNHTIIWEKLKMLEANQKKLLALLENREHRDD